MSTQLRATVSTRGVRADFYWLGDRFGHTISVVRGGQANVVWRSIQGESDAPVFQELHQQEGPAGEMLLFLSGAGRGAHWSMSVTSDVESITFDVAARVSASPTDRLIAYATDSEETPAVGIVACDPTEVEPASPLLSLRPEPQTDASAPVTLRWKYAAG